MKATRHSIVVGLALGAFLAVAITDCGGKTDGNSNTVSGTDLGGGTGLGGSVGLGGSLGSGGIVGTGGGIATGGTLGTGGIVGTGGSIATGGSAGSGGHVVLGGSAGSGAMAGAKVVAPRPPAVHRPQASSCVGVYSPPEPPGMGGASSGSCTRHADCTAGTNGKCATGSVGRSAYYYTCYYDQCATDADCDPGKICYCTASSAARCLGTGNCRTDADCGGGAYSYCSPSRGWDCAGYHPIDGFHCHTASDSCMDDSDCTGTDYCDFNVYDGTWKCTAINNLCAIG